MGKKRKAKELSDYVFDLTEGLNEDIDDDLDLDDDIFGSSNTSNNGGLSNMATTGVLETNPFMRGNNFGGFMGGMNGLEPIKSPDYKELQRNLVRDRIRNINIAQKELKKAKKKIENNDIKVSKLVIKDGESLTKREKKLLDKINIIRAAQGKEIVQILDKIDNNDKIRALKEKYKIYECSCDYADNNSIELKFDDFCEYVKIHSINEMFLVKLIEMPLIKLELTPWNDTEYIKLKKDIKTWNKIINKIKDTPLSYVITCYENNLKISTKIDTGYGFRHEFNGFMTDDVYMLHKEDLLSDDTFGCI